MAPQFSCPQVAHPQAPQSGSPPLLLPDSRRPGRQTLASVPSCFTPQGLNLSRVRQPPTAQGEEPCCPIMGGMRRKAPGSNVSIQVACYCFFTAAGVKLGFCQHRPGDRPSVWPQRHPGFFLLNRAGRAAYPCPQSSEPFFSLFSPGPKQVGGVNHPK